MKKCIWPGCQRDEQPTLKLCRPHWFQVAPHIRLAIVDDGITDGVVVDWINRHRGGSIVPKLQAIRRAEQAKRERLRR